MTRLAAPLAIAALLCSLAVFTGCPDDATKGSPGTGISLDDLAHRTAQAMCEKIFTCCNPTDVAQFFHGMTTPTTVAECTPIIEANLDLAKIAAAVNAGTVSFDADKAGQCVAAAEDATCDTFWLGIFDATPACKQTFMGSVADGGACTVDEMCVPGATCIEDGQGSGTCRTLGAIGASCAATECVHGAYCNDTATCAVPKADGGDCQINDECSSGVCVLVNGVGTCTARPVFCE